MARRRNVLIVACAVAGLAAAIAGATASAFSGAVPTHAGAQPVAQAASPNTNADGGKETATLIAAVIAAAAAVAGVATNAAMAYYSEGRQAHREALVSELAALSEALHQVVATSSEQQMALRKGKPERATKWRATGQRAVTSVEVV
jgi:hypothetical protein